MKKFIFLLILGLITTPALALESGSVDVRVTINKEPYIGDFLPADGYTIEEGDTLEISVDAADPNESDILQYQFTVNGVVKQPWNSESSFSYTLEDGDIGLNRITVEVTDGLETVQTQEVEIYVFRKPIAPPQL